MKRYIILAVLVLLGIAVAVIYSLQPKESVTVTLEDGEDGSLSLVQVTTASGEESVPEEKPEKGIKFSHKAGFYSENIEVELSAPEGAEIYFTTDGSDPAKSGTLYTEPIVINAGKEVRATTIKALAVSEGVGTGVYTRSFVTGSDVDERFGEETLVFVLSTDPYNLYDYEYGIAVPGKIYDDYVKEHPGEEIPYNAPGNYYMSGREAERDMYVEVFEPDGSNVISQAAGVRVVGGYSRVVSQKSFKLIARKEYDSNNGKFKYAFFPDAVTEAGVPIAEYDRIVLRNGANDREFAGVRDELTQQLARDYGYASTQHTVPAAVFLNGEYYGFSWLHENYNEDYLATQYGGNKEQYEIVANTENPEEGTERGLADFAQVTDYINNRDLTDDKTFEEFCRLVDIDDLMQYYAIQIFISNKDWPGNNYKAYRYYPAEGEELTSEKMDGRWRFLLFDAEFAWGLYGDGSNLRTLSDLLSGSHMSGKSVMLEALLKRPDMREKLADTLCDLMSGAFSTENILETLDELCAKSDSEQMYALKRGIVSEWANEWTFEDSRNQIREFAEKRQRAIQKDLCRNFDIDAEYYDISVTGTRGARALLGSQETVGGIVSGSYFTAFGVTISAQPFEDFTFVKWEVDGTDYTTPKVRITADMAKDGKVTAKLVVERGEVHGKPLRVGSICTDKGAGAIKLVNPNDEAVTTAGLFLTDSEDNLTRWALPDVKIEANSELLIVMKNNKTEEALMQIQATFSLKAGETLILSDKDGNILQSVPIPEIPEGKTYTLLDSGSYTIR